MGHPTEVVQVYGRSQCRRAFEIRDFLSRSVVHFSWTAVDTDFDCTRLIGLPLTDAGLPIVDLPGGTRLRSPSVTEIANRLGWVKQPKLREYDVSIYGAGPAGLSAAVYAASEGLSVVVLERDAIGGQAGYSSLIEHYLGFPGGISGRELAERARQQAVSFGAELLLMRDGWRAQFEDNRVRTILNDGTTLVARSNICATGVEWRRLGLAREDEFIGRGLFYGAGTSEAPNCEDLEVFVVGGGNSASQAAMNLSAYAKHVTMLVRGTNLSATLSAYLEQRVTQQPNVTIRTCSRVTELDGTGSLTSIRIEDSRTGVAESVDTARLFVCIGGEPDTEWAAQTPVVRDHHGFLVTGSDLEESPRRSTWPLERTPFHLETAVPGSFAAGDVRRNSVRQVASAVGEGAMAVTFVHHYLSTVLA
ncbi:FAD-dependent oxidoreductase [Rhodococcus sp. BP-252]|uniref:Pyridine nucleotide-disulfide oxidoreductase n=1 Tax=Rhodococcoides kyotonense TaxID=398843 RepID=A0A177YKF1_9NOCA|nr:MULTISPECIES: NAD(P)/FAD-dependent oxidoreductase [Rhodococcus]MBY6464065.1 FAD-dependent oxidoreductase [Rhodococcus sp. BP-290]MBY6410687.1 FAD-dependent oxidoreductase [Rhodococcus sp. BP-320]MBY6415488.1 FAD-dependent oxidoreductase [Rhodococcus sp. BP-321]MBY6420103.1 FAD-dependent oxidoreductase [Rhodococcus sp. BP-324]MBY6425243.1 FAD-dependent oxidoreductase [Rhodococcus sp. BP-323]